MFGFQELFDKEIKDQFRTEKLAVRILENGLEDIGLSLTEEQRLELEEQFSSLNGDTLTFDFSDEQLIEAGFSSEEDVEPNLREIVEGLSSKAEKFANNIDETMQGLVDDVTDSMSESVLQALEEGLEDMLNNQDAIYREFGDDIQSIWGDPLCLLQGLIVISDETAQGYFVRSDDYAKDDVIQELLVRIHAKAVQIAKEILILLRNGFSDGAQARWRTLHEFAVISVFIVEHGEDTAERYVNHEMVDIYKAATQYNHYYTQLGAEAISTQEIEKMQKEYLDLLIQYGQNYKYDYGWAAKALNLKKPTFRDIEASVNLDHHRPYYKIASANVHGNPAGVFSSLGLFPEEDIILSGPSELGLAEPAQSAIISLNIITTTMLTHGANLDSIVICKVIAAFGRKVEDAFNAVESNLS